MFLNIRKAVVLCSAVLLSVNILSTTAIAQGNERVFELRTYTATPGNLDKLLTRFRDHTMRIFEKHGMTNIAYWIPTDETEAENTLVYILAHESRAQADRSWQAFSQDPEWQKVNEDSNADGAILEGVVRKYMTTTDFSPMK
ncbi:MAG: NIPSNAP family protein [Gammaproteobacteria bacterium]